MLPQILGLLISFISFAMYASLRPYIGGSDAFLAMVAQVQIFLSLLSSIAFKTNPNAQAMTIILVGLVFIPPVFAVTSETCGARLIRCVTGSRERPSCLTRYYSRLASKATATLDKVFDVKTVHHLDQCVEHRRSERRLSCLEDSGSAAMAPGENQGEQPSPPLLLSSLCSHSQHHSLRSSPHG